MKTKFTLLTFILISFWGYLNAQTTTDILSDDFNLTINELPNLSATNSPATSPQMSIQSTIDPVLADSLQAALHRAVDQLEPIGLSVAMNFGGGDIWAAASGISSDTDSLNTDHVFPVGSVSKTITSACIVSMVDEGLLNLDDTVGTWISGYPEIDGNIRVYQLLNHTSGIYNFTSHPDYGPVINSTLSTTYSMTQMLDNFLDAPYFDAGEGWEYSNTNYLLLGLIIESISGQDYHTAVRERVLAPNGFDDIVLLPQESANGPIADVWQQPPGQAPINISELVPLTAVYSSASAAGAYAATPTDISEWARQLYSGEILGDATDLMYDYNVDLGNDVYYGLGVISGSIDSTDMLVGHDGAIIYTSFVYYIPGKDVSFAIHTNDGTKFVDLTLAFLELYNECVEYELAVNNETVAPAIDFNVHPNPADSQLFITYDVQQYQPMQINLYHSNGQLIRTLDREINIGLQQINIDVSDLASGVYFVELVTEDGVGTQNVIIK